MKSVEYILYAISIGISWDFIGIDWECKIEYIYNIYISRTLTIRVCLKIGYTPKIVV